MPEIIVKRHVCNKRVTSDWFWTCMYRCIENPHFINRKLIGGFVTKWTTFNQTEITRITSDLNAFCHEFCKASGNEPIDLNERHDYMAIAVVLISKNSKTPKQLDCFVIDKPNETVHCVPISSNNDQTKPRLQYTLSFVENRLELHVDVNAQPNDAGVRWLENKFFVKFIKWLENDTQITPTCKSLCLIDLEKYTAQLFRLKETYGKSLVEIWTENTDPLKFVYEDIAIAAYLITLWADLPKPPTFVDVGCGNGLLVYILTREGYVGFGVDVRCRKIWSLYPETVDLRVDTIIPSQQYLFPASDWIIGNHSDELTVWTPVIAARSSVTCSFFLLPCCAYEFDGAKYQRQNSAQSQYIDFMDYVADVSRVCGYDVEVDRLRIPSTKRTCFIGRKRTNFNFERALETFINARTRANSTAHEWCANFKPRANIEPIKNCTQIDKLHAKRIIDKIFACVVSEPYHLTINNRRWNVGARKSFAEMIDIVDSNELRVLKRECGGLQTLLKNHHFIFDVHGGTVGLRVPQPRVVADKKRACWMLHNHPDGCPLTADQCE